MKIILSLVLFISVHSVLGQSNVAVYSNEIVSGTNYITGLDIVSTEFVFPEKIFSTYIDTISNELTVKLRGTSKNGKWLKSTGQVVFYDLTSRKEKWFRTLNYTQEDIDQNGNNVFITGSNKSIKLNIENGAEEWSIRNNIVLTNLKYGIIAGYRMPGISNTLEAFNLASGQRIWKREINREFGWNGMHHLSDSVVIIAASGLHTINLKNGTGWDYHTQTGRNDYTSMLITNAAGIALGLLTGTFMYDAGHDVLTDIVSNLIVDSSAIYLASRENFVSYSQDGRCNWQYILPKEMTSSSSIFAKDSTVFLINRGFAFFNGRLVDYGTPFFAAFDKKSGNQVFMQVTGIKKEQVMDYEVRNDELLLVFRDRLAKHSMKNGSKILEKSFSGDTSGVFVSLAGSQVFYKSDSGYFSVTELDTSRFVLVTEKNNIIMFNDKLEPELIFNDNDLYVQYEAARNFKLINRKDTTLVIDKSGKEVAEFCATNSSILIGTKLYEVRDKSYIETDLSEVLLPHTEALNQDTSPEAVGRLVMSELLSRPDFMMYKTEHVRGVHYAEACAGFGATRLAGLLGDSVILKSLAARYSRVIDERIENTANHVDVNVYGILPLELYAKMKDKKFLDQGLALANSQWEDTIEGGLTSQTRYWIDDIWMIGSLQIQAYRVTGNRVYLDRAAKEIDSYIKKLQQPNGLFYHGLEYPFFWGRGNGWVAAGLAELISELPEDNLYYESILAGYRKMMNTLIEYQAEDGMWRQLIDKPESYKETSSTAMFGYAMTVGYKKGLLPEMPYKNAADKAWKALTGYLNTDGKLRDICVGTGQTNDLNFYLTRPRSTGDLHGQAPLLWFAFELLFDER